MVGDYDVFLWVIVVSILSLDFVMVLVVEVEM